MAKSVPVRCPACRREHSFTPPTFPCACGAPLTLPVSHDRPPHPVRRRTWEDSWVAVRCPVCDRRDHWPQPELGCPCGMVLQLPVAEDAPGDTEPVVSEGGQSGTAATRASVLRPAFRPVTIRTARDAVTAAAQYLKWLGFSGVRQLEERPLSGVDLRASDMIAQVDPTTRPTDLRDVECLWLNGLNESATAVFFSLAGYAHDARARADELVLPLFVMDLTGTPQPVNDPADDLIRWGPPTR